MKKTNPSKTQKRNFLGQPNKILRISTLQFGKRSQNKI